MTTYTQSQLREIDALVAERVMGWDSIPQPGEPRRIHYGYGYVYRIGSDGFYEVEHWSPTTDAALAKCGEEGA